MVPKYSFRVETVYRVGDKLRVESRNYETMPAAMSYRAVVLGKPNCKSVSVLMVLDETKKDSFIHNNKRVYEVT